MHACHCLCCVCVCVCVHVCVCVTTEGEDALIVACEDDHYVVVAGTFEKLVEQLACEEKPGIYLHVQYMYCTQYICVYMH